MPTTILQAPVGTGKTEFALNRLSATMANPHKPFAKVWVLLATKRQEVAFRQRLIDLRDNRAVYFNGEFFSFYELNTRLLNLGAKPRRRVDETARYGILRACIQSLERKHQLLTFKPILHTSGFTLMVAELIDELKQNRVYPSAYLQAAMSQKDRELALIYDAYQDILQANDFVDLEGEGWLALDALEERAEIANDVDLVIVDGYDQFTVVQTHLLAELSKRVDEMIVTLTQPSSDDGQGQVGRRFRQAQEWLQIAHDAIGVPCHIQTAASTSLNRHPDLLILSANIFSGQSPVAAQGAIKLVEAPEPQQEIAAICRQIKQLLLNGTAPDDILIAVRDWSRYHAHLRRYANLYEIPLLSQFGEPLNRNPTIAILLKLLKLSGDDPNLNSAFRRRDLVDVLQSPYIDVPGLDEPAITLLELVGREKQVVGGRDNWLRAIDISSDGFHDDEGEYHEPLLTTRQASDLSLALQDFFDYLTPHAYDSLSYYVELIERLIGSDTLEDPDDADTEHPSDAYTFNMPACIRSVVDDDAMGALIQRDVEAMNLFKKALRGMMQAQEFLQSVLGEDPADVAWRDVIAEIETSVRQIKPMSRDPHRSGQVLAVSAAEARGLPHDHVFIIGLSEGIFPATIPENPLHLTGEIVQLRQSGVFIQTPEERADDNGIFYELVSLPRSSLTLSRPYIHDGRFWVESHLWRMTQAVFSNLEPNRIGIGDVVPAAEVAALDEVVLAVADGFNDQQVDDEWVRLYQWLSQSETTSGYWQHIVQGRETELQRLSPHPHDEYSGMLRHPDLIEYTRQQLGDQRLWSATQFNDYGICPYRFFAKRLLKLNALEEPEEGLNALQLGLINHAILENTYAGISEEGLLIVPDHQEVALEILEEVAAEVFRGAPEAFGFRPTMLWREEQAVILRRLQNLVALDFSESSPLNQFGMPREPFAHELQFGFLDTPQALIPTSYGRMLRVRGSIDRIDRVGDQLIVVDYKTGSSPISKRAMQEGRNFQMIVYLLALSYIAQLNGWKERIGGGVFWHIRTQNTSGMLRLEGAPEDDEIIADARQHLSTYLEQAKAGYFAVQPPKVDQGKCIAYCEFDQLCRLAQTMQHKQGFD